MHKLAKRATEGLALQSEEIVQTTANGSMQFEDSGAGRFRIGCGAWLPRMLRGPGRASLAPRLHPSRRHMKASESAIALVIAKGARFRHEVVWLADAALVRVDNKESASFVVSANALSGERPPRKPVSVLWGGMNVTALAVDLPVPTACRPMECPGGTPGTRRDLAAGRAERLAGKANVVELPGDVKGGHVANRAVAELVLCPPMVQRWPLSQRDRASRSTMTPLWLPIPTGVDGSSPEGWPDGVPKRSVPANLCRTASLPRQQRKPPDRAHPTEPPAQGVQLSVTDYLET
jgi:hypothetical protein